MAAPWEETYETAPAAKKPAGSAPPVAVAKPAAAPVVFAKPSTADDFDVEFEKGKAALKKAADERVVELPKESPLVNDGLLLSPPVMVGLGGAAGAALMYGGSKAAPMVKRWLSGQNAPQAFTPDSLAEPPLFGSPAQRQPVEITEPPLFSQTPAQPAGDYEPSMSRTAAPSQNLTIQEAQARMAGVTPAAPATAPVTPAAAPVVPEAAVPAMVETPKPIVPSAAPNSAATKAVTDTIQQLGQEESAIAGAAMPSRPVTPTPALPTGEPVPPVLSQRVQTAITGVPKTVQDQYAKEGKVVLKGYGVGDRSLTNTYGIPAYAKIIDYFNEGKPIGDDANYQIIRKKINQGVPASLAAEFAAKLPGSEAEAGNFGKAFGETGAYTKEGKVVTSPAAMKKAVAGGGALFLATAFPNIVNAAQKGDTGPLLETAFDVGVGAIPVIGTAAQALMGTNVGAPTVRSDPYAEVLQRPGVKQVLQNMSQTMSPSEFNVARDQYLSKLSSFPEYNSLRFTKPVIGSSQPINRRTLLPVAPPR